MYALSYAYTWVFLPMYDFVNDGPLFGRGFAEIDAGCFNTLMSHKVCKECDVIATIQETLCEAVAERMRIYNNRVYTIPNRQFL